MFSPIMGLCFGFSRRRDVAKPAGLRWERGHLEASLDSRNTDLMSNSSTGYLCFIAHQVLDVLGCRSRCLVGYPQWQKLVISEAP